MVLRVQQVVVGGPPGNEEGSVKVASWWGTNKPNRGQWGARVVGREEGGGKTSLVLGGLQHASPTHACLLTGGWTGGSLGQGDVAFLDEVVVAG